MNSTAVHFEHIFVAEKIGLQEKMPVKGMEVSRFATKVHYFLCLAFPPFSQGRAFFVTSSGNFISSDGPNWSVLPGLPHTERKNVICHGEISEGQVKIQRCLLTVMVYHS